ncbi:hypothetical protein CBL_02996 [Carabus blaptoides fortunei]
MANIEESELFELPDPSPSTRLESCSSVPTSRNVERRTSAPSSMSAAPERRASASPGPSSTAPGPERRLVSPRPGCSRERITPAQKKRKISDAAGSPSCTRSREETPTRESTPTRRGRSESADIASALNKIANNSTTDDYDIFGNFVSSRLRKLGKDYSEEVEHDIINIIFAAKRRKKYDS